MHFHMRNLIARRGRTALNWYNFSFILIGSLIKFKAKHLKELQTVPLMFDWEHYNN